jgi:hypothetical protein
MLFRKASGASVSGAAAATSDHEALDTRSVGNCYKGFSNFYLHYGVKFRIKHSLANCLVVFYPKFDTIMQIKI